MDPQTQPSTIPQPPQSSSSLQSPSKLPLIIGGVILTLVIGAVSYYLGSQSNKVNKEAAVISPTKVLPSPTITTDETINWKVYSAGSFYEFKYPIDKFSVHSGGDNIFNIWPGETLVKPNDLYLSQNIEDTSDLSISAMENKDNLTLNDASKLLSLSNFASTKMIQKQISFSGLNGIRFDNIEGQGGYTTLIFVIKPKDKIYKSGLIYKFKISNTPAADNPKRPLAEQILSTFRFIYQNEESSEGKFCGGIAGILCPDGYECKYDGNYPDAGGKCVKK
ncbi:MAG: hypothetical protein HYW86_01900 [Candidatus Roizmanbacteria bacterium]|nr:MAG: hypothetical protein HYW86_01900 [Candidatus Roizmanbacteria bacterium]